MRSWVRFGLAVTFALTLAGCETPQEINPAAPPAIRKGTAILLAPPDVELFELTIAGIAERRADWSDTGERNVLAALRAENVGHGARFIELDFSTLAPEEQAEIAQVEKLHRVVADSMMGHRHVPALRLPTKTSIYDWSLGPDVALLRKANSGEGDYALFVTLRDSFSSSGRVALQVFGALLGVGIPGGAQVGYASLVDLNTGKVAWFGSVAKGVGDLREPAGARETVAELLQGLSG